MEDRPGYMWEKTILLSLLVSLGIGIVMPQQSACDHLSHLSHKIALSFALSGFLHTVHGYLYAGPWFTSMSPENSNIHDKAICRAGPWLNDRERCVNFLFAVIACNESAV